MELDWGVASLPLNGQSESGDRYVVQFFPAGFFLGSLTALDTAMKLPRQPERPSLFSGRSSGACDFAGQAMS